MTRRSLFVLASVLPALALACGDYSRLKGEVETYQPPVYAVSRGGEAQEKEKSPVQTDYALEKGRINTARARWEDALKKVPASKDAFFCPPSGLLNKLVPAASDPAVAAAALIPRFSLETLMTLALLRNPEIQAGQDRARAATDTYSQILALDDILRRYTAFTEELMTGIGPMKGKGMVDKEFPFPGVLSLKGEIVNQGVKGAMEGLTISRRNAVTEAQKAYWNLLFVRKAEKIAIETLNLYKHLEQVAMTRYETGSTSYQDVIKVRIERELLEEGADTFHEKVQNWKSKILEIINLPPETEVGRPENREPVRTVPAAGAPLPGPGA
ncbi:MAG: TolC family protein [Deltaproteobacteria bacterium]|nr:TolC family protein [Deltaproteobacteria bacterium]